MKYSFLLSYFDRSDLFYNTLVSFRHHYGNRNDWEIILIEDVKNLHSDYKEDHKKLLKMIDDFADDIVFVYATGGSENEYNPVRMINQAASMAEGKYYIITAPEILHYGNILKRLDRDFSRDNKRKCMFYGCFNADVGERFDSFDLLKDKIDSLIDAGDIRWIQHSEYRKKPRYYCAGISKDLFNEIGGLDEGYAQGYGVDDRDFNCVLEKNKIDLMTKDAMTVHQYHYRVAQRFVQDNELEAHLFNKNRDYFNKKWGKNNWGEKLANWEEWKKKRGIQP